MATKFDDSLPNLIRILRQAGVNAADSSVTLLRETTGRLLIACTGNGAPDGLAQAIIDGLGDYAAPTPVVAGALAQHLANDPSVRLSGLEVDGQWADFHFIDRRLVGADWLRDPVFMPKTTPPRLVFGSLKGGVGRSTAIAVLAAELAESGKKVLVVDLDLEAPGAGFLLLPASEDLRNDLRPRYGVIDYLIETSIGTVNDDELVDFVGVSPLVKGLVHVLPAAGRITDENPANMMAKLSRSMVERIDTDGTRLSVAENVKAMVDLFCAREKYDVVLVDARAGLAELSAAALFGIGAHTILLFGTDQQQTFRGYRYMLAHLVNSWGVGESIGSDWRSRIAFVHAKASSSRQKRQSFRDRLYELCLDELYDQDDPSATDGLFSFAPDSTGLGIPHDALHIAQHPDYDAFDPVDDRTQLDEDVYRGPFGDFLARTKQLLEEGHPAAGG
ncbi:conserved hypothetical protein [Magnetospirillum sp. LM-5]|uniref:tyrosine-protein kinase family protein n=1 Tax=Magnetospirillum sp. LM-5 TaxID=2681466 RepID=UPI00137FCD17|nr:AAA family ATPase [Magnetospirillum sp. LM-5]CAA7616644.1 conserved hypothetical protein [Magnetospirillum sp. LM-5]